MMKGGGGDKRLSDSELLEQRRRAQNSLAAGAVLDAMMSDQQQSRYPDEQEIGRMRQAAQNWNPHSTSTGIYGQAGCAGAMGISGTCGPAGAPGRVQGIMTDYIVVHKQLEAELKAKLDKKPEQAKMPRALVTEARFEKGPSLLHRLWHFLTRDDGLNDYHKTKEIYERRETILGDARGQVKGGRRIG